MVRNLHHRKPRSLSGDDSKMNTIRVAPTRHNYWHRLFGNSNPLQIVEKLNSIPSLAKFIFYAVPTKHCLRKRLKFGDGGCRHIEKSQNTWTSMFGSYELDDALSEINQVWLDPEFQIDYFIKQKTRR